MLDLVNRAKQNFHETLLLQANELAGNIKAAAPVRTGALRDSVRVKDVSTSDGTKLSALVIAGGPKTTKRESSGPHDYSVTTEYGSVKEAPEPFFFSTFRLYKQQGLEQFKETLDQTIDENNRVRALRGQNYNNSSATVSVGHRGAIVIQKGKR
jgi:hypothetical protein